MKPIAVMILGILLLSTLAAMPNTVGQAVTGEKEFRDLGPVHVVNDSVGTNIACWGNDLAWSSYNNITTGTVSGGAGTIINTKYYSSYNDLAMSDSAIVWTNVDHYKEPYTASDIAYAIPGSGTANLLGTNTEKDDTIVRIDGNKVVYEANSVTGYELRVATIGGSSYSTITESYYSYDISGDNVAVLGGNQALQVYDTGGTLLKDWGRYAATNDLKISGDYLAYYTITDFGKGSHIMLTNWKTNESQTMIYSMEGFPGSLDIEDNFVVFTGAKSPEIGEGGQVVFLYDIQAQKTYQVSPEYPGIYDVAIGGGRIAWSTGPEYLSSDPDLNYCSIYSAALPAPGKAPIDKPIVVYPDDECAQYRFEDGVTTVALDEGIKFTADDGEHRIYARGITNNSATLDVYSDLTTIILNIGETKAIEGLNITLESVDVASQTVKLTVVDIASTISDDDGGFLGLPIPSMGFWAIIMVITSLALILGFTRRKRLVL